MMIPLRKILSERVKLKILRQQIFSLTKIKGVWFLATHLFNSLDQAYLYEQATRLYQHIVTVFETMVGYRNVLSNSKFMPINDKNEFGHSLLPHSALGLGKDGVKRIAGYRRNWIIFKTFQMKHQRMFHSFAKLWKRRRQTQTLKVRYRL